MFRLLTDEDFDNDILRGLLLRRPALDIVRVQDSSLAGEEDPVVLEWAAQQGPPTGSAQPTALPGCYLSMPSVDQVYRSCQH